MLNIANQVCSKILMSKLLHARAHSADRRTESIKVLMVWK